MMSENKKPASSRMNTSTRLMIAVSVPVVLVLAGIVYFIHASRFAGTDNAYVKVDKVSISSEVSGQLTAVAVGENQKVKAGQLLFRIDDRPYKIALDQARAKLNNTVNDFNALRARYRQKQEELKGAQYDTSYFDREYKRQKNLAGSKVASEAKVDATRHEFNAARQDAAKLEQELQEIVAQLDGNPNLPLEAYPPYRDAMAGLDRARLDLGHTVVTAPADGIASKTGNLQVGNYAFAGAPMLSLIKTNYLWVEANMKETDLTHVVPGQKATAEIDTYPGRKWDMTVASVAPATGAEFAILPPQNSTGNWVKVVQRIPVRLEFDDQPDQVILRAGMSVTVSIDTGTYHALPNFLRPVFEDH